LANSDDGDDGDDGSESSGDEVVWFGTRPIASGSGLGRSAAYSGFSSSTESDDGDVRFVSAREARSRTAASSQTIGISSQQPGLTKRTAPRPIPYQVDPARGYVRREVIQLIDYLEYWSEVFPLCPLCHLMEDDSDARHQIEDCPRTEAWEFARAIRAMEKGMREVAAFTRLGVCPRCGVPQELDADLAGHSDGLAGRCKYEGVLVGGIVTMYAAGLPEGTTVLEDWFDRDRFDRFDEGAAIDWFSGVVGWGGLEVVRAVRVFYMLSKKNVGKRYMSQFDIGARGIARGEWVWKRYLE
jgi:hypothetical protein